MKPQQQQPEEEKKARKVLKVAIICQSDTLGGAAVVTYRLMYALRQQGIDARMLVFTKLSQDVNVRQIGSRPMRGYTFMGERIGIAMSNGFSRANLFKVSTATKGLALHRDSWVKEADVVMLSWINQGLLSLNGVRRIAELGKPMVWVMHDMWNLTGICHHAYDCRGYMESCGKCPFLSSRRENDLSRRVWKRKQKLYAEAPMTFVPVSNWLADCCRSSGLLSGADIRVIPNAFPIDSFVTQSTYSLGRIVEGRKVIAMGAARLDDPIKGLDIAIDVLNYLFDNKPEVARRSVAVFFGAVRNRAAFDRLRFPHQLLGRVNDPSLLRQMYAKTHIVMSTSHYETLPGTLIEGMAAGCLAVTFGQGGQTDIVDHLETGYIAKYPDVVDFAKGLEWALARTPDRDELHELVRRRFSATSVAERFADLFEELLHRGETGVDVAVSAENS